MYRSRPRTVPERPGAIEADAAWHSVREVLDQWGGPGALSRAGDASHAHDVGTILSKKRHFLDTGF